jgi:serine/threonine-protein kinase ULK4
MDNFILYDEISKSANTIIYKGRRKGSINFVSIHCIDKSLRAEITNLVRLTYEIVHKNVVKFYEWYETSNHLWLVVELCTGGTLEAILKQDQCMPESSIRNFGIDLCEGLFHVHQSGLLFCDLNPKKIMVDGNGTLKLGDFGLSKLEGENLEEIFQEAFDNKNDSGVTSINSSIKSAFGDPLYIAPEVHKGEDNSKSSDLWGLGCLLYAMYTGVTPFHADNPEQIADKIINKELPYPKGNKLSTKPSNEFVSLLKGLLEKDCVKRFNWSQVARHPFWEGRLVHLVPQTAHSIMVNDSILERSILTDRPKTAHGQKPEVNVSFSMSSRLPVDVSQNITLQPIDRQISEESTSVSKSFSKFESKKPFFISTELNTSQIIDNPKIQKPSSLKFEPKSLPIANNGLFRAEKLLKLPRSEFNKQLDIIKQNTNVPTEKTAIVIKNKLHLLNYIGFICTESSQIANELIDIELYKDLVSIIKGGHNLEMKMKAARIVALIFSKATRLDPNKQLTEVVQNIIGLIQSNRNDVKFKQGLLPALGELMCLISSQEALIGKSIDSWQIPSLAYSTIVRSFGDDLMINHIVCKISEKIASSNSSHIQKFISIQTELLNGIWSCFSNSSEGLRMTALSALCLLTSHSIAIFQSVIEKVTWLDDCLDCISSNNTRIQQSILTMFAIYIDEVGLKNIPEKVSFLTGSN